MQIVGGHGVFWVRVSAPSDQLKLRAVLETEERKSPLTWKSPRRQHVQSEHGAAVLLQVPADRRLSRVVQPHEGRQEVLCQGTDLSCIPVLASNLPWHASV